MSVRNSIPNNPQQPSIENLLQLDLSQDDRVPNTRPDDMFLPYEQVKWNVQNGAFFFKDQPYKDRDKGSMFFTIRDNLSNRSSTTEIPFTITYSTSSCCSTDQNNNCVSYCDYYYVIKSICIVVDLKTLKFKDEGCLGGFGSDRYYVASYQGGSQLKNSAIVDFYVRESSDPYYNIPFIIGYGIGNTWGVSYLDRVIIFSLFYSITGVYIIIDIILFVVMLIFCIINKGFN